MNDVVIYDMYWYYILLLQYERYILSRKDLAKCIASEIHYVQELCSQSASASIINTCLVQFAGNEVAC